jgi:hypothetical protein
MHSTVRFLTETRAFQQCHCLMKAHPQKQNQGYIWRLGEPRANVLREENMRDFEREMLAAWTSAELEKLQEVLQPGDAPPRTIIPKFLAWLLVMFTWDDC